MAAVQQRSPTEQLADSSKEFKGSKFIESMEDEVRRCAEHLERRQSRKLRSLDRKANGFSTGSMSATSSSSSSGYFEDMSAESRPRSKSSMSSAKTLPRSFTLPSEPEERSILSPRIIPPGRRSPMKSPERSKPRVFKFSNSIDVGMSSQQQHHHHVREHSDPAPASYHKGNSAPPEASPFFSAGSGSCSRENSVTPLQSPLGRTPIGAVASHSRRSSRSSSSPPPVPPKRVGASPPVVPPKPPSKTQQQHQRGGSARSRRMVSPIRSHAHHHKVEVKTVCRESLKLSSPPPPLDPITVSKLSAEQDGNDDQTKKLLEFPSAEVDLRNFHEKVLKAKSLLQESTGGDGGGEALESSVDAEDYGSRTGSSNSSKPAREHSAPPTLSSSAAAARRIGSGPAKAVSTEAIAGRPDPLALRPLDKKAGIRSESNLLPEGTESSVDVPARAPSQADHKTVSEPSLVACSDHSEDASLPSTSDACFSDPSLSLRDSELSVDDHPTTASSSAMGDGIKEEDEEDIEIGTKERDECTEDKLVADQPPKKVESLGLLPNLTSKLPDQHRSSSSSSPQAATPELKVTTPDLQTTDLELPGTPKATEDDGLPEERLPLTATVSAPSPAIADDDDDDDDNDGNTEPSGRAGEAETPPNGRRSPDIADDAETEGILSVSSASVQSGALSMGSGEAYEPEVKSIPKLCRKPPQGSQGSRTSAPAKHSRHGHVTAASGDDIDDATSAAASDAFQPSPSQLVVSSVDKPPLPPDAAESATNLLSPEMLEGLSEPVALLIKELQIKLREKEGDIARLQRVHERERKEHDEKTKKLTREAKKVEREKWELLKRARDAAERSLHLRTQLDMKEGSLRSVQGELDRTRDELVSVKSANTSLRALLSDLRAQTTTTTTTTSTSSAEIGIQVELQAGSLRRNRSIELAFSQGGLSQEQDRISVGGSGGGGGGAGGGAFERNPECRMSSSSLGLHWPERSSWGDRDGMSVDSASLQDEAGRSDSYQPLGSRESRKSRKSKGAFFPKMKRSSGKRGSRTSMTSGGQSLRGVGSVGGALFEVKVQKSQRGSDNFKKFLPH